MTSVHETVLGDRLRQHVERLADEIGERNVFHPQTLHDAERYIRGVWSRQGYQVLAQEYVAAGVCSANLEVTLTGQGGEDMVVIGAHYDTVTGSPGQGTPEAQRSLHTLLPCGPFAGRQGHSLSYRKAGSRPQLRHPPRRLSMMYSTCLRYRFSFRFSSIPISWVQDRRCSHRVW